MAVSKKTESKVARLGKLIEKAEDGAVKRRLTKEFKRAKRRLAPAKRKAKAEAEAAAAAAANAG